MKCPWQIRKSYELVYTEGQVTGHEEITEFGECLKDECPYYYVISEGRLWHCCKRTEKEGVEE